ncbi:LysM peptidoglycan-binding domain-containing protein [Gracilibacillus salitolerans]|uniref:LysM peptidoglycan-binding domain-containing protein n=1 Tax=Gracilibacillus salitolerans TaxID=2663022 RepID=A0A5Q2TQV9_9BACI|nr:3D domain-containing protein [Gracilibacillus salitolerans]QGH36472.1 LysM peptidoglycan-binding domain-containing protein [Gracilibacillus salitolerans]
MRKFLVSVGFVTTSFFFVLPISAAEYEVEKGDSLWDIAQEHNTTVADLKEINKLDSDLIFPKQILEIDREITYNVERGDSLSEIAVEHDVTVSDLKEWNNLETDLIIIDEKLTIKEVDKDKSEASPEEETQEVNQTEEAQEVNKTEETPEASEPKIEKQSNTPSEDSSEQSGETISVTATAYTAECDGCSGVTATGIDLLENRNMKVIAVDPSVIPLGTRVHVEGYGEAIAGDTGGAIKGNKIDIHVPTKDEAYEWGVRSVDVTILD